MAVIPIGDRLNISLVVPNIDYRFGPYQSIGMAIEKLQTDEAITPGLAFGVYNEDGSVSTYEFVSNDKVKPSGVTFVLFGGIVEGDVQSQSSNVNADPVNVMWSSTAHKFALRAGGGLYQSWNNKDKWIGTDGTPYTNVIYINMDDMAMYVSNALGRLVPVTVKDADTITKDLEQTKSLLNDTNVYVTALDNHIGTIDRYLAATAEDATKAKEDAAEALTKANGALSNVQVTRDARGVLGLVATKTGGLSMPISPIPTVTDQQTGLMTPALVKEIYELKNAAGSSVFGPQAAALMVKVLKSMDFGSDSDARNAAVELVSLWGGDYYEEEQPEPETPDSGGGEEQPEPEVPGEGDDDTDEPTIPDLPPLPEVKYPNTLPSYWYVNTNTDGKERNNNDIASRIKLIKDNRQAIVKQGHRYFEFIFVTDIHWGYNAHMAGRIADYLKRDENLGWMPTVFGGDVSEGTSATLEAKINDMRYMMQSFNYDLFSTLGNHDFYVGNSENISVDHETLMAALWKYWMKYNNENTHYDAYGDAEAGYFDVPDMPIRMIQFRNEWVNYQPNRYTGRGNWKDPIKKLKEYLASMPDGYKAILICHGTNNANVYDPDTGKHEPPFVRYSALSEYADKILFLTAGHIHGAGRWVRKSGDYYIPQFTYGADRSNVRNAIGEATLRVYQLDLEGNTLYDFWVGSKQGYVNSSNNTISLAQSYLSSGSCSGFNQSDKYEGKDWKIDEE